MYAPLSFQFGNMKHTDQIHCVNVTQHVPLEPSLSECCVTSSNRNPLDGALNTGLRRKEYGRRNFQRRETYFIHVLRNMEKPLLSVLVSLGVPELLCNSVTPSVFKRSLSELAATQTKRFTRFENHGSVGNWGGIKRERL